MWNGPELPYHHALAEHAAQDWGSEPILKVDATTQAAEHAVVGTEAFTPLALRDYVVIMLLFDQVVREEQVERAWQLWQQMPHTEKPEPLWRVLTLFPDLDRDLVYAEAARVYGFEEARIVRPQALAQIHALHAQLPEYQWEELVALRVVPVAQEVTTVSSRHIFATQDPMRPEVHRLLPMLDLGAYTLQFAREQDILNLLVEAFPQHYSHLKELSGLSKELLQHGAATDAVSPGPYHAEATAMQLTPERDETVVALECFDEALVMAVQQGATDVCLLPSPLGFLEVYLQTEDGLHRVHTIAAIAPARFHETIKRELVGVEGCTDGRIRKRVVERSVDGQRRSFRVAVVPASDAVQAECLVVHLLG